MKSKDPIKNRCCPNTSCTHYEMFNKGNIIRHSFYKNRQGRRRRYRCKLCNKTFCSTYGTPYYRLHDRRSVFDEVVEMSVHGMTISSISQIKKMAWNTIARWLKVASNAAQRFNDQKLKNFVIHELQADEIRTFIQNKRDVIWLYTTMDVWSRLWISTKVGDRKEYHVKAVISDTLQRGKIKHRFLFTTDGFKPYYSVIRELLHDRCVYGQVIKKWKKNRVIKVEQRLKIGTSDQLKYALFHSEDSSTLNTSFIERLNLTIRRGCAYLNRKTPGHARASEPFSKNISLFKGYYNFVRPHQALKFGKETRTPAQQAGLVSKRLTLREIFTSLVVLILFIQRLIMTLITFSSQPRLALTHIHAVGSKRLHFTC